MARASQSSVLRPNMSSLRIHTSPRELARIGEWIRYAWERLVIYPVAPWLPLGLTLRLTEAFGLVEALLPTMTARIAREEVAAATGGLRGRKALRLVVRRLTESQWHLAYKRFIERHGLDADWEFLETNPEKARAVLSGPGPVLLVGGHFQGTANCLVWARVLGESEMPTTVQSATEPWRLSPKVFRTRLSQDTRTRAQNRVFRVGGGARTAETPYLWSGGDNVWASAPKRTGVQDRIIATLSRARGRAAIYPDAIWEKANAYRRSFAGAEDRGFALGAARIARISQATIIPFIAVHGPEPLIVRIDWGEPMAPPPPDDDASDQETLDRVLAFLERSVARYPADYNLPIGWDREWETHSQEWQPRTN